VSRADYGFLLFVGKFMRLIVPKVTFAAFSQAKMRRQKNYDGNCKKLQKTAWQSKPDFAKVFLRQIWFGGFL
jgi:hypothetical protein